MKDKKIIEIKLDLEATGPEQAVLPSQVNGPTELTITPFEIQEIKNDNLSRRIDFRVTFEPENSERRCQPYRETLEPIFPDGWKYGDSFDPSQRIYD